ncbi:MAG: hypothetical protein ACFFFH_06860 [Candidatus Thorarchaeota archaeon]
MPLSLVFIFPLITTTIWFLFFVSVVEQYIRKRKPHQLVWVIALILIMFTMGAEAFSYLMGMWDPWLYRLYYIFAAVQVSILGAGVIYLFGSNNVINEQNSYKAFLLFGNVWLFFSFIFSFSSSVFVLILLPALFFDIFVIIQLLVRQMAPNQATRLNVTGLQFAHLYLIFTAYIFLIMTIIAWFSPVNIEVLSTGHEISGLGWQKDPMDPTEPRAVVRLFSPLFTVPGAIALIGGGFFSYLTWQISLKRETGSFTLGMGFFNIYISIGALILAVSGILSGFGIVGTLFLYISDIFAVVLMYFGFLESDRISLQKIFAVLTLGWFHTQEPNDVSFSK